MFRNKVFKYRTFNEYSISELNNKTWWFACAKDFNDPFEFRFTENIVIPEDRESLEKWLLHSDSSSDEITYINQAPTADLLEHAQKLVKSSLENHNAILSDRSKTRICCLSQECSDPLMWSHYTNGMKGFVVIYNQFKTTNDEYLPAIPVDYDAEPPVITFEDLKLSNANDGLKLNTKLIATKHNRWEYEKELRFISCEGHEHEMLSRIKLRNGGVLDLPEDAIYGVIVGENMPNDHFRVIETICNANDYKIFKAKTKLDKYEVDIFEIES